MPSLAPRLINVHSRETVGDSLGLFSSQGGRSPKQTPLAGLTMIEEVPSGKVSGGLLFSSTI